MNTTPTPEAASPVKVRRITEKWLTRHTACDGQRELFVNRWPKGADLTGKNIRTASEIGLDMAWFAARIMPKALYADYEAKRAPLDADYEAKRDTLYADYQAKRAPLYADYEAKRAPLDADYEAKRAPLYADYEAKRDTLYADYQAKRAPLLIEMLGLEAAE